MSETVRNAACLCGRLRLTARGDPAGAAACSCSACQRRTGSVYGVSAYYPASAVTTDGEAKAYARTAANGRQVVHHFCPDCGSTLWFTGDFDARIVGVAVGCFADPDFPAPQRAVWTGTQHRWVRFPDGMELFETQKG